MSHRRTRETVNMHSVPAEMMSLAPQDEKHCVPQAPLLTRFLFSVICGVSACTAACTDASLCHTARTQRGRAQMRRRGG